ncbi:MAG: hypothetical protein PHD47_03260 [Acholeplasmataceae bacterium]|nr:hypothetical protein [Acholeplasmataceae bacterium]
MHTYKMIDLNILIDYKFNRFYKDNIEAYLTFDKPTHFIYTHLVDEVIEPKLPLTLQTDKRTFYEDSKNRYVVYHNAEKEPLILIKRSKDYTHYDIYLDQQKQAPLDGIEYTIHQMVFMEIAVENGFTPIHASAFSYQDKAYLVSAPSGIGKTTLAKRMARLYQAEIINDDKPLLKIKDNQLMVYSSPFSGKEAKNLNSVYPLGLIIFIEQGLTNEFKKLKTDEAINLILKNMFRPDKKTLWNNATVVMDKLIKENKVILYQVQNHDNAGISLKEYIDKVGRK